MTLLANEATSDSRKLLRKYNKPDATSSDDLENKLTQLYFDTTDKVALEKEMASIHPHKKWLLKYEKPAEVIEKKIEAPVIVEKIETCKKCEHRDFHSSFDAQVNQQQPQIKSNHSEYIGMIGMVAVVGCLFFLMSKTIK